MAATDDYIAAGLHDPDRPVNGRLELLGWLDEQGFTVSQMLASVDDMGLTSLATDHRLVPGRRVSTEQAVELSGLSHEQFMEIAVALGLSQPAASPAGLADFTEAEAFTIAGLNVITDFFSHDEMFGFIRVVGSAMSRIAEAAVAMFLTDVEGPHLEGEGNELELAQRSYESLELLEDITPLLDTILRRHLAHAAERGRQALINDTERDVFRYAVGFVDLVGFTPISHEMSGRELGRFIRDFERRAHDAAATAGARVVKLIGDEVMFVSPDATSACEVAEQLMTGFDTATGHLVVPRGGLAYGPVVVRGGDYYGSIVNVASRLVDLAEPGELLVTGPLAEATGGWGFEPAGRRRLKGIPDPVAVSTRSF